MKQCIGTTFLPRSGRHANHVPLGKPWGHLQTLWEFKKSNNSETNNNYGGGGGGGSGSLHNYVSLGDNSDDDNNIMYCNNKIPVDLYSNS